MTGILVTYIYIKLSSLCTCH